MNTKNLLRLANVFEKKLTKKSEEEDPRINVIEDLHYLGESQGEIKDEIINEQNRGYKRDNVTLENLRKKFTDLEDKVIELRNQLEKIEDRLKTKGQELGEDLDPYGFPDYD